MKRTLISLAVAVMMLAASGCSTMSPLGAVVHDHCKKSLPERLLMRETVAITTSPHRVVIRCYGDG